jgi:hypothetical protein
MRAATEVLGAACAAFIAGAAAASGRAALGLWIGAALTGTLFGVLVILSVGGWWRERTRAVEFVTDKWTVYCRRRGWTELSATVDKFASEFQACACTIQIGDMTIPLRPDPIASPHMLIANRFVISFRADILPAEQASQALADASITLRNGLRKRVRATVPVVWTD